MSEKNETSSSLRDPVLGTMSEIRPGFPVFELEQDGDDGCDLLTLVPRKGQTADIQVVALGGEEVLFSLSTLELRELHRAVGRCLGLTNCAQDVTEADDDDE